MVPHNLWPITIHSIFRLVKKALIRFKNVYMKSFLRICLVWFLYIFYAYFSLIQDYYADVDGSAFIFRKESLSGWLYGSIRDGFSYHDNSVTTEFMGYTLLGFPFWFSLAFLWAHRSVKAAVCFLCLNSSLVVLLYPPVSTDMQPHKWSGNFENLLYGAEFIYWPMWVAEIFVIVFVFFALLFLWREKGAKISGRTTDTTYQSSKNEINDSIDIAGLDVKPDINRRGLSRESDNSEPTSNGWQRILIVLLAFILYRLILHPLGCAPSDLLR